MFSTTATLKIMVSASASIRPSVAKVLKEKSVSGVENGRCYCKVMF
jgi:hypothetical protein